ncbi:unnamed protein product [Prorocentrum cordatum]|uniref:Uncharacterized protein n=1 Tax=Prorocentrum cordatum TaxID=2364126 RepID=A0ABN9TK17_9DINO|nr:unnamed protein product [Polarella glacialis]
MEPHSWRPPSRRPSSRTAQLWVECHPSPRWKSLHRTVSTGDPSVPRPSDPESMNFFRFVRVSFSTSGAPSSMDVVFSPKSVLSVATSQPPSLRMLSRTPTASTKRAAHPGTPSPTRYGRTGRRAT